MSDYKIISKTEDASKERVHKSRRVMLGKRWL